jgi:predicted dehydrogenase
MLKRKLRMGMIGGGPGSFIGAIHRIAACMDGRIDLVSGAFSSDPDKSKQTGAELNLSPERIYGSYKEMIRRETELPASERMDLVSIVTPNHLHFEPAKLALEHGFHVILDKPVTFDLKEALELQHIVEKTGRLLCVTYTYTGYPMLKEARQQVLSGKFGKIRKILVEYPQGWLSTRTEDSGNLQAQWRTDPSRSGAGGASADIGTHAFNLAEYVSGLEVTHVCADLNSVVEGRKLDDDASALLRFNSGAGGLLLASQVAAGEENNIRIRVYGESGGIEWCHADPNTLLVKWTDKPTEAWRAGSGYLSSYAKMNTRTPAGHPEGYLEAFANHYRNFADCICASIEGVEPREEWLDFPGIDAGVRGMRFVEKLVESGKSTDKWIAL